MNSVSPLGCRKVVYKDSERTPDELLAIENDQVMSKISACTGFSIWLSTSIVIGSKREKTRPFSPQGLLVASEKKHLFALFENGPPFELTGVLSRALFNAMTFEANLPQHTIPTIQGFRPFFPPQASSNKDNECCSGARRCRDRL